MKKIIVPYVADNEDLYFEEFDDEYQAKAFIEGEANNYKCLMISIESSLSCDFNVKIEDHT